MKHAFLLFLLGSAAFAQPGIAPPQIGILDDGAGVLRPLLGIAGNFVWRDAVAGGVDSSASSGKFGLFKTDTAVVALNGEGQFVSSVNASAGGALFAFTSDGSPALAFAAGALFRWMDGAFQQVSFDPSTIPGTIVSIFFADADHAGFLVENDVQNEPGLWESRVSLSSGLMDQQTLLAGVSGPALRLANGDLVTSDATGIVISHGEGTEVRLPAQLPLNFALSQMGDGWVRLSAAEGSIQFAIRVTSNREAIFQLPGAAQ